ncbi:hypothetical protein F5148DRAFT_1289600 [Russula earlei]|uniref:Uncharacterized protein n=1 Tax=Russula earlei TaxID=71964 RepID=A0ACC0TYQ3_9AGAM|nr:hypothetical protein F5148DRAFT_1289600 [Russula earlei]
MANTIGALILGWGVSSLFFGMLCIQVWTYCLQYPNDSISYKLLVLTLWVLEAVHQAFVGHVIWFYVKLREPPRISRPSSVDSLREQLSKVPFHDPIALKPKTDPNSSGRYRWIYRKDMLWNACLEILSAELFGYGTHCAAFFSLLSGGENSVILTHGLVLSEVTAIVYISRTFHLQMGQLYEIESLGTAALSLGVITDLFTAASLSLFLHKMRTGYKKSDTLINRLIIYSVNTGVVISVFSAAVLASYNLMPTNLIFIALYFVLSKLYANSCLATLNSRRFTHGRGTDREEATIPTFVMVAHTLPGPLSGPFSGPTLAPPAERGPV